MQNIWKTIHARGSRQIEKLSSYYLAGREHIKLPRQIEIYVENLSRSYPEISMDQEFVENRIEQTKSTEIWLDGSTQLSRSYRGQIHKSRQKKLMSSCCRDAVEKVSRSCRADISKIFQGRKNTQDECKKIATQTSIQVTC